MVENAGVLPPGTWAPWGCAGGHEPAYACVYMPRTTVRWFPRAGNLENPGAAAAPGKRDVPLGLRHSVLTHVLPPLAGFGALLLFFLVTGRPSDWLGLLAPVVVAAAVSVACAALLGWLARRDPRPGIRELTIAAHRLGEGVLDERLQETPTGELVGLFDAFNRMSTDLAQIVRESRAERERLAAVLERSADGVFAVDDEGRLCYLNAAARRVLEVEGNIETLSERSFVAVVRDHELDALMRRCRESGSQETQVIQIGSHRRAAEAIVLPLRDAGAWRYLGLLHDLTEIRRVEDQRRDFISNVSHELRTPLASIKAVVQVLADGGMEDEEQAREFLRGVDHEVDRLSQLVEEMLELSRIESGQVPFRFEPVDAGDLCADAVRRLAAQAERAGVALRWTAEPDMEPLQADHERLLRALINLVHNAIKFTPAGGSVTVEARRHDDMVEIAVRDTGGGIATTDLDRIFERFYKADRARASSGTGLGLAIVKHTIQAHGGYVGVESTVGIGSTFRLVLPCAG
jgi:two-component system phosphate regulon sensor histidine kinase PhoR